MARLSLPLTDIAPHYTVVVIGSGYGGGIAASRLARAGQRVCVLERGREFQPGEYPATSLEAGPEIQINAPDGHTGSRTGLFDFHVGPDINALVGCGLGGTSLINANVALTADPRVFDDPRWPAAFRADAATLLADGYRRAEAMLRPVPYPDDWPRLPKTAAHARSAERLGAPHRLLDINVNFAVDGPNHVGVTQHPCTLCGDCVTGCNHGAKNTTLMNYLPDAVNHGAQIFTQTEVRWLERQGDQWVVHFQPFHTGRERFDAPTLFVRADVVVLAAGTLGTAGILLRSRARGLALSDQLGRHFTGNGDVLGFGWNGTTEVRGFGFGHRDPRTMEPVGPCITSVIDTREAGPLDEGMVIEEGTMPGPLTHLAPAVLASVGPAIGKAHGLAGQLRNAAAALPALVGLNPYRGAPRHTQTFLIMAHDDGEGVLDLHDDRVRIRWPGVGTQPVFVRGNALLAQASEALGATFVPNPTWTGITRHNVTTVHPLGGCVMADHAGAGVVDHKGRVFAGAAGTAVHAGLYVADGSVMPRSLGVNPLFTISAVAERACALLAADRGWTIDYALPSRPAAPAREPRLGIQFTETMRGTFSTAVTDDFVSADAQGRRDHSTFEFTLTVLSDDLDDMLANPAHQARMVGTALAPALSPQPLVVTDGVFNLFVRDPAHVDTRRMVYRMTLTSVDGRSWRFEGFKTAHHDASLDEWRDTSTLYITVWSETGEAPLGRGILRIKPDDFLRQMTTLEVRNARNALERIGAVARFGRFFAGKMYDLYGGVAARPSALAAETPPRRRRPLRAPAPEPHPLRTTDGADIRLTRFQGGRKGPVILAPGFGTSGLAFTLDTVETNLPEYLVAHGFDVFVLDYRASPELPVSRTQFTVDEIATRDWPAAVAAVRELSGAGSVQVVGHCVGSLSFLMAQLAGLEGVRSAVCSALTLFPDSPLLTSAKADTFLGNLLYQVGVHTMSTDTSLDTWQETAFETFMRLYPSHEVCRSPVCRRILFMYGEVYKHELLNEATHEAIHEVFGRANFTTLKHMTTMIRHGRAVDAAGRDVYLPNVDRLRIPIALLHGAENRMFLPSGSEKTLEFLRAANGGAHYSRHVIPAYGHMDAFIGRDAAADVFPIVATELERHN